VHRPRTFELLYIGDAVTFAVYAGFMFSLRSVSGPVVREPHEEVLTGGYRDVLRDRAMQRIVLMSVILLSCGSGALEVGFPYFATKLVHVSERIVAFGYVGNTLAIVLGQLLVIRLIQGRRRTRVLQLVGVLWALSWVVLGLAVPAAGAIAVLLVVLSPIVFAVGETLFQPVAPAMVNDLAPEHLRGRYNTFGSLAWSISGMLGPAIAGALLGAGLGALWITTVTAGCLMASVLAFRIRAVLTPAQDGITTAEVAGGVLDAPTVQAMAGGEVRD
jgi:MFS family permease